jgi:nucleoside-diphosphate-sugar epimerase
MPTLVCLGIGYCARHYVTEFGKRFDRIIGTTRSAPAAARLAAERLGGRKPAVLVFDGRSAAPEVAGAVLESDALLVSAAPTDHGDPVLAAFAEQIAHAPRLRSVVLLSSLGVYADTKGAWVDEAAATAPDRSRRGSARLESERGWLSLAERGGFSLAILRLGGIYGPGRNAMVRLLRGTAHRIAKPGHVSNRIHVFDIAQAIDAAFERNAHGIFNVVDDEPAPPADQIAFAARLMGIEPPPEISFGEAARTLPPFVLGFYEGCIRARNDKLKGVLGVRLRYPIYRTGLRALFEAGDHLAAGGGL